MYNQQAVSNLEKTASIVSYISMGIIGLIWILTAYFMKKKIKFFLMYNMLQSICISVLLAAVNILINSVLHIFSVMPFLNSIGSSISSFLYSRIFIFSISFNKIEILVFFLFIYISIGILLGRIFYVPVFTKLMKKIMHL